MAEIIQPHRRRRRNAWLGDTRAAVNSKYVVVVSVIVIIFTLTSLYFTQASRAKKINPAPFIGVGQVLAEETAKAVSDHGRIVLVVSDPSTVEPHVLEGFLREIGHHRQIQIVAMATHRIEAAPFEDPDRDMGMTKAQFAELLNKHQAVDAMVTFLDLPAINPEQPLELPRRLPKIFSAVASQAKVPDAKTYLRDNVIVAFIAPRPEPLATAKPRNAREWCDKYFQVFTLQNLDALR